MVYKVVDFWALVGGAVEADFDEIDGGLGEVFRDVRVVVGRGDLPDDLYLRSEVKNRVRWAFQTGLG